MPKDKSDDLRLPAEILFAEELDALIKAEKHAVPAGWRMSPRSVLTYICGGKCGKLDITAKYIGHQRLVEIAISTLVTDRALLLIGEPGTAKSWFSEIATANTRDRGVNDMSAALKRRFNLIILPAPADLDTEVSIVTKRVGELASNLQLRAKIPEQDAISKVVTIFRELRAGQTLDGKNKVKTPSGVLSTAEAISLLANSMALSGNFGDGTVSDNDLASGLQGAVIKDDDKDHIVWKDYLVNVMKKRGATWRGLYTACQSQVGE